MNIFFCINHKTLQPKKMHKREFQFVNIKKNSYANYSAHFTLNTNEKNLRSKSKIPKKNVLFVFIFSLPIAIFCVINKFVYDFFVIVTTYHIIWYYLYIIFSWLKFSRIILFVWVIWFVFFLYRLFVTLAL